MPKYMVSIINEETIDRRCEDCVFYTLAKTTNQPRCEKWHGYRLKEQLQFSYPFDSHIVVAVGALITGKEMNPDCGNYWTRTMP